MQTSDFIYLGIDPGGREPGSHAGTGLAVVSVCGGVLEVMEARRVHWDEWVMAGMAQEYLTRYDIDLVVVEDFIPRWGQKFELDSVFLIGSLRGAIEPGMIQMVTPAAHKAIIKRDWAKHLVKEAGFPLDEGHPVDAVSLCLYTGVKTRNQTVIQAMKEWNSK